MILSDTCIKRLAETKQLVTPYDPDLIQPASLEVRLGGDHVVKWMEDGQWLGKDDPWQVEVKLPTYISQHDKVVLATTLETVRMPTNLVGIFSGKSTLARMGISTHLTAGFIDPGFEGEITLELLNESPLPFRLEYGMKIGQITFWEVLGRVAKPYGEAGNHYQKQTGPTLAMEKSLARPGGSNHVK